ncbi:MAG: hypothetical protein OWV35_02400, partial [Firmicutes bacterium]|nr:hypothetical protein [Bacillota bacterium]
MRGRDTESPAARRRGGEAGVIALLAGLPFLFFLLRWALGEPVLNGDNLIQNFPLRVLSGAALRSGHLPLWDPYLWSGTPLLAGFNAGAAYPLTWLFAVLPAYLAWSLNLAVTYALAATGFYRFLRSDGRSRPAAFLGAATFAYGGFLVSQMVHVETVEGVAWLPWAALAVKSLLRAGNGREMQRALAAAGAVGGLIILTGSPEAIAYGAVFLLVLSLRWWREVPPGRRRRLALRLAAAGLLALAVGAVQWVPGEAFIRLSQRARASYAFFASMSLPLPALALGLVPYVQGGYGFFWMPMHYVGRLNLPEITWYSGLLPVAAALELAPRLRTRAGREAVGIWYLLGGIGLLWALGDHTPLGLVLYHIPVLNGLRAQNRNLFWVDFALAALFAVWVDERLDAPPGQRPAWRPATALLAAFGVALLAGRLVAVPVVAAHTWGYVAGSSALALGAAAVTAGLGRCGSRRRLQVLVVFTALDLGLFDGAQYWIGAPRLSPATGRPAAAAALQALAGRDRFAVYNPRLYHYSLMDALGQPDLNILTGLPSVQGYGSLVAASYQRATGSHVQATLDPAWL